jgi:hypothetical protein
MKRSQRCRLRHLYCKESEAGQAGAVSSELVASCKISMFKSLDKTPLLIPVFVIIIPLSFSLRYVVLEVYAVLWTRYCFCAGRCSISHWHSSCSCSFAQLRSLSVAWTATRYSTRHCSILYPRTHAREHQPVWSALLPTGLDWIAL